MNAIAISYSVVIRTLGDTGEKYRQLLNSIQNQTIQPDEIIVVIPEGYELQDKLGNERVVYAPKGMVSQRFVGIEEASSDCILVVDDDVCFNSNMIEELHSYMISHNLDCVLPMEGESDSNTPFQLYVSMKTRIRGAITGQLFTSKRKSDFLDTITITGGHKIWLSCNNVDNCYYCQCGNFQCFYIKTAVAKKINFRDEVWLQQGTITQYASYDDPTFFYKLYLMGYRMAYALKVRYVHLDASVGRPSKSKLQEKTIRYYSVSRNRTIFWYKFIWKQKRTMMSKAKALFGGMYGTINYTVYNLLINCSPKYWPAIKAMFIGYYDAIKYIKSHKHVNNNL